MIASIGLRLASAALSCLLQIVPPSDTQLSQVSFASNSNTTQWGTQTSSDGTGAFSQPVSASFFNMTGMPVQQLLPPLPRRQQQQQQQPSFMGQGAHSSMQTPVQEFAYHQYSAPGQVVLAQPGAQAYYQPGWADAYRMQRQAASRQHLSHQ